MTWYRSFYWRVALGFIACLALLLVVQAMLFVWMMAQAGSAVPNQPPERLAQTVASDVARALESDPALDIERYVRQEFARDTQPFVVLLPDGRTITIGTPQMTEPLLQDARARLDALRTIDPSRFGRGPFGRGWPPRFEDRPPPDGAAPPPFGRPPDGRRPDGGPPPDRFEPDDRAVRLGRAGVPGPGFRGVRTAPIVANSQVAGLVVVPPRPPFAFLLARYAPTLVTVALATLVIGAALAAVVVFGPTRRRLKAVEEAARRLGGGDLTARAPAGGHDEVAEVASAFNAMASDLAARTEALVAADRARRQLLADVSHELNTPVTAMRGYLETLAMPELGLDAATRARYLAIVGDETARLERIIGDLLDLARLEGGGGTFTVGLVRVDELFARVRARHERAAEAAGVVLQADVDDGANLVDGDGSRLEQALQNLAANALRHAPPGTSVSLRAARSGATVTVSVTDEGPGIPVEHLAHVFDRFYKVDQARAAESGSGGGSGLGLSIVKAIVERHGATIRVESRPGRTVFEIAGLRPG